MAFFRKIPNSRRRHNIIETLNIDDDVETNKSMIAKHIDEHFKKLIGITKPHMIALRNDIWREEGNYAYLEHNFTKEVKTIVMGAGACSRTRRIPDHILQNILESH